MNLTWTPNSQAGLDRSFRWNLNHLPSPLFPHPLLENTPDRVTIPDRPLTTSLVPAGLGMRGISDIENEECMRGFFN